MDNFLIRNQANNTYQEIMRVNCTVEAMNRKGSYRYEKSLLPGGIFAPLHIRNAHLLDSLEEVALVEDIHKRELLKLVKEQRDKKVKSHRAQTSNYVLKVNDKEVFNMKRDFDKLWEVTDEQLKERIEEIRFSLMGNGAVYKEELEKGYLI